MINFNFIIAALIILNFNTVNAQLIGPNTSLLEQAILSEQYKALLYQSNGSSFDPKVECYNSFVASKAQWEILSKTNNTKLMPEGRMEEAFSHDEILKMGSIDPVGRSSIIRGSDKYIIGVTSRSGMPSYPHARLGCEKMFKEEMVIKEIAGKQCREIKMTFDQKPEAFYYQVYCENETMIRINFAPNNEFSLSDLNIGRDCVFCR